MTVKTKIVEIIADAVCDAGQEKGKGAEYYSNRILSIEVTRKCPECGGVGAFIGEPGCKGKIGYNATVSWNSTKCLSCEDGIQTKTIKEILEEGKWE